MRMSEIIETFFPTNVVAVLSGPNLAIEVSRGLPTATVIGCREQGVAEILQRELGGSRFRVYTTDELTGAELGGALKNIFAIAAGISDGFGLGDNSKSALVTRSLAELVRLGTAMGGQPTTFYGLSGAGDLIATCFSAHSRNRRVGEQLGRGQSLGEITSAMKTVAEGIPTTKSAFECARKLNDRNAHHRSGVCHSLRRKVAAAGDAGFIAARSKVGAALVRLAGALRKAVDDFGINFTFRDLNPFVERLCAYR